MLKIGTLFSGGLAAVEWAIKYEEFEHEIVFACEWDKYARKQYLAFHGEPTSCFYEDVSDMDGKPYFKTIDLMVWGSPCQDLSLAGKRKGFGGEKSSLFREGARIMSEVMPKAFIFENVKGLLSSNGGNDYKEVEKTFRDMGYHMAIKVVNAKNQGTAQNRERVFVVGFLDADDYHNFHFADDVPLTKCLRDYLEDDVDEKYYLSEKMIKGFISHPERHKAKGSGFEWKPKDGSEIVNCLRANGALNTSDNSIKVGFVNQDTQASSVFSPDGISASLCSGTHGYAQGYLKEDKLIQAGELDIKGADSTKRVYRTDGLCPTMTTMGGGNRQPKVLLPTVEVSVKVATNIKDSVRRNFVRDYEEIVKCEKPIWYSECESGFQDNKVCLTESACLRANNSDVFTLDNQFRIRRLTPRECFRLMGMRDEDIDLVNSDTQSYKIAGNGIEINTMRSIVRQLYKPVKPSGSLF